MHRLVSCFLLTGILLVAVAGIASASFHFMQIEQVIGSVNGDPTAQAIQLRMRSGFQNQMQLSRLRVVDATGNNPIMIIDMTTSVPNSAAGSRVLITSPNFANYTSPAAAPDFVMTNLIPESYLAAGSLLFESDTGIIYWRLSWGGAGYTGSNTGSTTNDANGNFGPPFASALPSPGLSALRFNGPSNALSTTNAADYSITVSAATFNNNANAAFAVVPDACDGLAGDMDEDTCLTGLDLQAFTDCVLSGSAGTTACDCADVNSDSALTLDDVDQMVDDLLGAPACP